MFPLSHKQSVIAIRVAPMLHIAKSQYEQLRRHGEAAYPHECCGILLGSCGGASSRVEKAVAVDNASPTPDKNYEIAAESLIAALREAQLAGLEILGFYHSHPDHPAHPSPTDLAEAHWIGSSYVITAVRAGAAGDTRTYKLSGTREEDKRFDAEDMAVIP